jgi:hypothetical protein
VIFTAVVDAFPKLFRDRGIPDEAVMYELLGENVVKYVEEAKFAEGGLSTFDYEELFLKLREYYKKGNVYLDRSRRTAHDYLAVRKNFVG